VSNEQDRRIIFRLQEDVKRLQSENQRLKQKLSFAQAIAKDLYSMVNYRVSKKDLMGIGFTKQEADEEWVKYRRVEAAVKGVQP